MIPIIFGSLDFLYLSFKYQNTFNKAMFKWFWTVFSLDSNSFIEWTWLSFETTRRLWSNLERSYVYLNIMPLLFRIFYHAVGKRIFHPPWHVLWKCLKSKWDKIRLLKRTPKTYSCSASAQTEKNLFSSSMHVIVRQTVVPVRLFWFPKLREC